MSSSRDFRSLSPKIQAELRRVALKAVESGTTQQEAATLVGVQRQTVSAWVRWKRLLGEPALKGKRRGRLPGSGSRLSASQSRRLRAWIVDKCPEQLKLPFALWTRHAVGELILREFGLALPLSTIGDYLRRWEFTAQRPAKRAYEQQPERIEKWLNEEYPTIAQPLPHRSNLLRVLNNANPPATVLVSPGGPALRCTGGRTPHRIETNLSYAINGSTAGSNRIKIQPYLIQLLLRITWFCLHKITRFCRLSKISW